MITQRQIGSKFITVNGVQLSYYDVGPKVQSILPNHPVIFVHGMCMSKSFFQKQINQFSEMHRVIVPDLRGHGQSEKASHGHTMTTYGQDLHALLQSLGVGRAVLVGWSMGVMVVFEYLKKWVAANGNVDVAGMAEHVAGVVLIDQAHSDFKWPGYPFGVLSVEDLAGAVEAVQTDMLGFVQSFVPDMLERQVPTDPDSYDHVTADWMTAEVMQVPPNIASTVIVNQTLQDYRPFLDKVMVPSLLVYADDARLTNPQAGPFMQSQMSDTTLFMPPDLAHCLFFEQPRIFNSRVEQFINGLPPVGTVS